MKMKKKAMQVGDIYNFVLLLVLVGIVLGVGILVLDKFAASSGIGNQARIAINNTIGAIDDIPNTWLAIVVVVMIAAVILGLVIRSFSGGGMTR